MSIALLLLTAMLAITEPEHDPAEDITRATVEMYDIDAEKIPLNADYIAYVCGVCQEYTIDPAVIFGIAYQESRFRADVTGDSGKAKGMYQIQQRWHEDRMERLGVTDLYDERQAVRVACDYLAEIREEHPDIRQMLTVYRYGDLTVRGEDYATIVLQKAEEFRK